MNMFISVLKNNLEKIIIVLLIIFFIVVILTFNTITNKIVIYKDTSKYKANNNEISIFKKYSVLQELSELVLLKDPVLFYNEQEWSIITNNYYSYGNYYFIIDKGYYYYITNPKNLVVESNVKVLNLDLIKYSYLINII